MRSRVTAFVALFLSLALALVPDRAPAEQRVAGEEPPHAGIALIPLVEDLTTGTIEARVVAAMAIRELGRSATLAVPELIDALSHPSFGLRKSAAGALGGIGPAARAAVPALGKALEDPHPLVRAWAAMALFEIGVASKSVAPKLVHLLEHDQANLRSRSWAASALAEIEAEPDQAIPALIRALARDPSEEVRAVAVLSLERFGEAAASRDGTRALIAALADEDVAVRRNAACAIPKMGSKAALGVSELVWALRDRVPAVRGCAARALGTIGQPAIEALDALARVASEDEDEDVKQRARHAHDQLESAALGAPPSAAHTALHAWIARMDARPTIQQELAGIARSIIEIRSS